MKNNLDMIYIRAKVGDDWGSYSLKELVDKGHGGAVAEWFLQKICSMVPLEEAQAITLEDADNIVSFMRSIGVTLVELKETQ